MRRLVTTALILTGLVLPQLVQAGPMSGAGNNARDYIAAPAGTKAMVTYWKHIGANEFYADQEKALQGSTVSADLFILRPIYWMEAGPVIFDPQMLLIGQDVRVDLHTEPEVGYSATGFADPILASTFWFVHDAKSQLWLGITPFLTVPIGEYNANNPETSPGGNRWTIRPEFGIVKGFGPLYLDFTTSVEFFGKNDNFDGVDFEQDPQYHIEAHVSYDLSKSFFVAADYYGYFGGETQVDGEDQNDKKNNHTLGLTGAYAFAPGYQLMLQWKDDISVKDGPKANTFMARWLYAW